MTLIATLICLQLYKTYFSEIFASGSLRKRQVTHRMILSAILIYNVYIYKAYISKMFVTGCFKRKQLLLHSKNDPGLWVWSAILVSYYVTRPIFKKIRLWWFKIEASYTLRQGFQRMKNMKNQQISRKSFSQWKYQEKNRK